MQPIIYWIEDRTDLIDPMVRPLILAGYEVRRLHSVKEALRHVDELRHAGLILLDLLLPVGAIVPGDKITLSESYYTGRDLLRLLRKAHGVNSPVLVVTVVNDPEVLDDLTQNLDAVFLRKPVDPVELKEQAERMIRMHN